MDSTTSSTGQTTDNNAFTPYSKGNATVPANMQGSSNETPRAVGKTSAPHQMGNGAGQSTTEYFSG